jgi:hypothetical protein
MSLIIRATTTTFESNFPVAAAGKLTIRRQPLNPQPDEESENTGNIEAL